MVVRDMEPPSPTANGRIVEEPGGGTLEVWALDPSEEVLHTLLRDLFTNHWRDITFGPLVQGAAYELRAPDKPRTITLLDGYLTVDWGGTHFHLCIGQTRGHPDSPTDPVLAQHRRTHRAELYRHINRDGTPDSWGLRLFNGKGEQQITVLFPNPFLTEDLSFADQPDWTRLHLWDYVRETYLGMPPDDRDRSGRRMVHP